MQQAGASRRRVYSGCPVNRPSPRLSSSASAWRHHQRQQLGSLRRPLLRLWFLLKMTPMDVVGTNYVLIPLGSQFTCQRMPKLAKVYSKRTCVCCGSAPTNVGPAALSYRSHSIQALPCLDCYRCIDSQPCLSVRAAPELQETPRPTKPRGRDDLRRFWRGSRNGGCGTGSCGRAAPC